MSDQKDRLLTSGDGLELREFADAEALRDHLDALNEAGTWTTASGIDSCPQPFLITLTGPYAEDEHVFFDSPWQGEVDWSGGSTHCEECLGHVHGIEDLRYPVTVIVRRTAS